MSILHQQLNRFESRRRQAILAITDLNDEVNDLEDGIEQLKALIKEYREGIAKIEFVLHSLDAEIAVELRKDLVCELSLDHTINTDTN